MENTPDLTDVLKALDESRTIVRESETWQVIRQSLLNHPGLSIDQAVAVGIGNPYNKVGAADARSLFQLALYIEVIEQIAFLQSIPITSIKTYIQHPDYDQLEVALYKSLGFTTLKVDLGPGIARSNKAAYIVTPKTFVFCPFPPMHLISPLLTKEPSAYISSGGKDISTVQRIREPLYTGKIYGQLP